MEASDCAAQARRKSATSSTSIQSKGRNDAVGTANEEDLVIRGPRKDAYFGRNLEPADRFVELIGLPDGQQPSFVAGSEERAIVLKFDRRDPIGSIIDFE